MNKMKKLKAQSYHVEGPDWAHVVSVNPEIFDDERSQLFEAASLGVEKQLKEAQVLNLGAIILVKKSKTAKKEAMVNAYLCLVNVGQYALAENLRASFKQQSGGQDLATDTNGYSY